MKIAFITTIYRAEDRKDVLKLKKEIEHAGIKDFLFFSKDQISDNRGYASGINDGIKKALKAGAEVFVIMNTDISLSEISGQLLLSGKGHFDIWGGVTKQKGGPYYGGVLDRFRMSGSLSTKKPESRYQKTDFVSGSFMCILRRVIEDIGYFDETYFMYYEEVDFCLRAKRAGYSVGIDTDLAYPHFEQSDIINPDKSKFLAKNRLRILVAYGTWKQKLYELLRTPKTILEMLFPSLMKNDRKTKSFLFNFMSLNISSVLGKFGSFILFIFLIRYFKPEDYGIYTLVWAQVLLFSPIVDLGTTAYGIVNLPKEKESRLVSLASLRLTVAFFVFAATLLASVFMFPGRVVMLGFIFLATSSIFSGMFSGTYLIFNAVKGKLYNSSLVSTMFQLILTFSLVFTVIFTGSIRAVFLVVFIMYSLYSLINLFLVRKNIPGFRFVFDPGEWFALIRKTYVYVLIGFFATLYFKIDVFLLSRFKGEQAVGIYSAGYKFFEASMFLAASYNIASTPIFAKLKDNLSSVVSKMKKDVLILLVIGFSTVFMVWFLSTSFLPIFMKGNYVLSIPVLKIVIFALPLILVNSVFLNVLYVYQKAGLVVWVFLFQALLNTILNIIFIPEYSYLASSYITVFSEVCNIIVLILLFMLLVRNKKNEHIG